MTSVEGDKHTVLNTLGPPSWPLSRRIHLLDMALLKPTFPNASFWWNRIRATPVSKKQIKNLQKVWVPSTQPTPECHSPPRSYFLNHPLCWSHVHSPWAGSGEGPPQGCSQRPGPRGCPAQLSRSPPQSAPSAWRSAARLRSPRRTRKKCDGGKVMVFQKGFSGIYTGSNVSPFSTIIGTKCAKQGCSLLLIACCVWSIISTQQSNS